MATRISLIQLYPKISHASWQLFEWSLVVRAIRQLYRTQIHVPKSSLLRKQEREHVAMLKHPREDRGRQENLDKLQPKNRWVLVTQETEKATSFLWQNDWVKIPNIR